MGKEMMKALLQTRQADGEKNPEGDPSTMELREVAAPPSALPGYAIVRVYAAALNPVDLKRTVAPLELGEPCVVGYDVAGVVESVASDVTEVKEGDRVFGDIQADTAGPKITGSIAEFAACRADLLARVPDVVSFVQAAALPLVTQTAIQLLRQAKLAAGERVFVTAGAGGVGIHLMQIAKALYGASEIATTASKSKEDFVRKYGADVVVDYRKEDAGDVLKGWADVVVDCTHEFEMESKIIKSGADATSGSGTGRIISIVEPREGHMFCLIQPTHDDMQTVARLLEEDKIIPVIDSVMPLDDVMKAVQRQASGRAMGKVVIMIRDE